MCGGSVILSGNNIALLVESINDNTTSFIFVLPSATYFFSTAKKSKQKMPLSNAEGLGTAQTVFVIIRHVVAFKVGWTIDSLVRIGLVRCA